MATLNLIDQRAFRDALLRAGILPLILMVLLAAFLFWQIERLLSITRWVEHSTSVVAQAHKTEKLLVDMETGLRGYLITSRPEFLTPYTEARPAIEHSFADLRNLVAESPEQTRRLDFIHAEVSNWETYAEGALATRRSGSQGLSAANAASGKQLMDAIRLDMTGFIENEETVRNNRVHAASYATNTAIFSAGGVTLLLGAFLALFSRRQLLTVSANYERALATAAGGARELRKSEERYRAFIERSSEGIYRFELEKLVAASLPVEEQIELFYTHGYLAECNDAMAQMYGYGRAEEIVGARLGDLLVRSAEENVAYLKAFIQSGYRLADAESIERGKDGDVKHFSNSLVGVLENGFLLRGWGTQRDVTERRQAEDSLAVLVDASVTLLGSPHLDSVLASIIELSQRLIDADAYAIWRRDQAASKWRMVSASGFFREDERQEIEVVNSTSSMSESPLVIEDVENDDRVAERKDVYRKEGIRSLLTLPMTIKGERSGTLTFYYRQQHRFSEREIRVATALANLAASAMGTAELYDEQAKLRKQAQASEKRSAFMAEAATVLGSSLDYQTTLSAVAQLAVPGFADWCSADILKEDGSVEQLAVAHADPTKLHLAKTLYEKYPPEPSEPFGLFNVLRTGKSELYSAIPEEMLLQSARSEEHFRIMQEIGFSSAMVVPLAAHGRTLGVLSFVAAESGHHYDAIDLALAEDLAIRAATAIDNARLYREAREANRIKDEFLATLSHELRTPMTAILGWTHLLKSGALDHEARIRAIDTIDRNARSQTQIIEDILDVSRIITGKIRLDLHPLEFGPVIQSAVESIRPSAEAKNISIESDIDLDAGKISGCADRLQQVVWNLLSNAIKFTPRDGRVKVRLRRDADAGVELCIADTGDGISKEFLPYVFDRFRQADGSTTRQHGGLGLGLSIVRQLVELHGGTIRAESAGPGAGAVFTIHLPFVSGTREIENRKEQKERKVYTSNVLKAARILIVEDEPDARTLLEMALKRNGAEVKSAADVTEAMEALKDWRPEILLSDLGMPTEDGFALIRQIRALSPENGGAIPSAALTAYAREEDRQRAIAAGFDMHIAKPVSVNELISAISTLRAMKNETLKPA